SYPPLARGRRRTRPSEGIATTEYPQLATDHRRARHVVAAWHISSRRPSVRRNVVIPQRANHDVIGIASPGHIQVTVDHARARAAEARRRRYAGLCGESVGHRIVLPGLEEGWGNVHGAVAAHQRDL